MSSPDQFQRKKRAGKACDSCRIKKTKCDGRKPCSRCISDNRICAYSDKRKKEKSHPPGYVELLETRVELLTRSLEQMVRLSEPHLQWLSQLMAKAKSEDQDHSVPINDVVNHLIAEHGILENMPGEWDVDPHDVLSAEEDDFVTSLDHDNHAASGHKRINHSRSTSDRSARSRSTSRRGSHLHHSSLADFTLDGVSLSGMNSNNVPPSLFRQDTSPIFSRAEMADSRSTGQILATHDEAASSSSSLVSLSARLDSHDLDPVLPGLPQNAMTPATSLSNFSDSTVPIMSSQGLRRHGSSGGHNTAINTNELRARMDGKSQHLHRQNTSPGAPLSISPYAALNLHDMDEFAAFPMTDPAFPDLDDSYCVSRLDPGSA